MTPAELRMRRRALKLSQERLAHAIGVAANTVARWERGVRPIRSPELVRLALSRLEHDQSQPATAHRRPVEVRMGPRTRTSAPSPALPAQSAGDPCQVVDRGSPPNVTPFLSVPAPPTPLIGRDHERAEVRARLLRTDVRLLTLGGLGGVGKSLLALTVAWDLAGSFVDGAMHVELTEVTCPGPVAATVARALGVPVVGVECASDALLEALRYREMLVVLDGCEQVVDDVANLATALLAACPGVKLLATSRLPLRVRWEHRFGIGPLEVPDLAHPPSPAALARVPSVALFVERWRSIRPSARLGHDDVLAVAEICVRLDGLPLAIELAAGRGSVLSPSALLARLAGCLDLLVDGPRDAPARQRTLRAALDWSYDVLPNAIQALFRRLGVFAGGGSLAAVRAVGRTEDCVDRDLLGDLAALRDAHLIEVGDDDTGEPRFHLLETVRAYAIERLAVSGELAAARRHHATYFTQWAERGETNLSGPGRADWLGKLERELDNLRAVLTWSQTEADDQRLGVRLGAAMHRFWRLRGYVSEGRARLAELLGQECFSAPSRLAFAIEAGNLALSQGDRCAALGHFEEALGLARALDDAAGAVAACAGLALAHADCERAEVLQREGLGLFQEIGDRVGMAVSQAEDDRTVAEARARLGGTAFAAAFTEGRHLPIEHVILGASPNGHARPIADHRRDAGPVDRGGPTLSAREREVAALVAQGLTNRRIAESLVVSVRTVDTHVERILNKLAAHSRSEIAAWAGGNGLLRVAPGGLTRANTGRK